MAYSKEAAAENRRMLRLARRLLQAKGETTGDSLCYDHPDVFQGIRSEFPEVSDFRVNNKIARALLQLRGESRQGHPGNKHAAKAIKKINKSFRFAPSTIKSLDLLVKSGYGKDLTEVIEKAVRDALR